MNFWIRMNPLHMQLGNFSTSTNTFTTTMHRKLAVQCIVVEQTCSCAIDFTMHLDHATSVQGYWDLTGMYQIWN